MDKEFKTKIKIQKNSKTTQEMNKYFKKEFSRLFSRNLKIPVKMYNL